MTSNNDNSEMMGLAIVIAAVFLFAVIGYAVACFIAIIFTFIALLAWNKPVRLLGEEICNPLEARVFVGSGIAGAVGVTAFAKFCSLLLDVPFKDEYFFYLLTGGYSLASITVTWNLVGAHLRGQTSESAVADDTPMPAPSLSPPEQPFRYAGWNDETE